MAVRYKTYGRNRVKVSRRWFRVLTAADKAKVGFTINSGHRTMAEQRALYNRNMIRPGVPKPGRPLTAVPNLRAPHIRPWTAAHALDVSTLDGGEARLERWIESKGADWRNTVRSESWHGELTGTALRRLDRRLRRH